MSLLAIVVMLRSTLSAQRIAAARLLAQLLEAAAPSRSLINIDGTLNHCAVTVVGSQEGTDATWFDVWTCLLQELDVTAALCAALDETSRPQVTAAALVAIAALLDGVLGLPGPCSSGTPCLFPVCGWQRSALGAAWGPEEEGQGTIPVLVQRVVARGMDMLLDPQLAPLHAPALQVIARYEACQRAGLYRCVFPPSLA